LKLEISNPNISMKTIKNLFYVGLAFTLVMSSCSMEKRAYRSGYHIDWTYGKTKTNPVKSEVGSKTVTASATATVAPEVAVVEQNAPVIEQPVAIEESASASLENAIVVTPTAPKIAFNRSEVPVKSEVNANPTPEVKQQAKKIKKEKGTKEAAGGDKSWMVALILCFFLGGLGIHRFYLGYTWQGVVQLLTFGGFGIWALIDFIRIIVRSLEPNGGKYTD
jgi:TM2 domain-containing membrane protein YozV